MSVNQWSLDEVVLAYIEAWSTSDDAVRRELLDVSLADDTCIPIRRMRYGARRKLPAT